MPAIKRHLISKSDVYRSLTAEASALGESNDCAVKALSVACEVPYARAHKLLTEDMHARKPGQGTRHMAILDAVRLLGKKTRRVEPEHFINRYPGNHATALKSVTTHHPDRFPAVWKDGKTYLVFTSGHVLCVKDGVNHDHTRGRACRVTSIYEVCDVEFCTPTVKV